MAKLRKVIEEIEQDAERVLLRFTGHVRHDGKDYHAGDRIDVTTAQARALIDAGAAKPASVETADDTEARALIDAGAAKPAPVESADADQDA